MGEFFNKLKTQAQNIWSKTSSLQKGIVAGILVAVIAAFIWLMSYSGTEPKVPLIKAAGSPSPLSPSDYERVKQTLKVMNVDFDSNDEYRTIYVPNEEVATELRSKLAFEGVIKDAAGFEIFDEVGFTEDNFVKNIKLHRVITNRLRDHIEALEDIEKATVEITFPKEEPFFRKELEDYPITARISIVPSAKSDLISNKKKIKSLRDFVTKGVWRLKEDNVTIIDAITLKDLTTMIDDDGSMDSDELFKRSTQQERIGNKIKGKFQSDIFEKLVKEYTPDRFTLAVNVELDWSQKEEQVEEVIPVTIKKRTPGSAYDDGQVKETVPVSSKTTVETYEGPAHVPEGSPGSETVVPPGMASLLDKYNHYNKKETVENVKSGTKTTTISPAPYTLQKVTVTIAIDGIWKKKVDKSGDFILKDGKLEREYSPVSDDEIRLVQKSIESYIGKNAEGTNEVTVYHKQFDRTNQFFQEDQAYIDSIEEQRFWLTVAGIIFLLILTFLIVHWIQKYRLKKKREEEERIAREQAALREAIMRQAEMESTGVDISDEDRERLKLQESAIQMAREKPEQVALLLRTWMSEE